MEAISLLSDDDDDLVVAASAVARMPSPRTRARRERQYDDDDSDVVEILDTPPTNRKRPRAALKRDKNEDSVEVVKVTTSPKKSLPPTPLQQVLELFPDAALQHVKALLKEHKNVAANVINTLIEQGNSYPKEPTKKRASVAVAGAAVVKLKGAEEAPSYDFMNPSSFQPSETYKTESVDQLEHLFPCLNKSCIRFVLGKSSHHFAIAHDKIVRFLKTKGSATKAAVGGDDDDKEERQFKKLKACTNAKAVVDQDQQKEFQALFGVQPKKGFFSSRPRVKAATVTDAVLIEEVAFVRGKLKKWENQVEAGILRKENRAISIKDGTALDCACCYEQVAMEEMVQCKGDGHLFCQDCLSSYVESQVFANGNFGMKPGTKEPALELLCFHGDGCGSGFDRFFLEKALKEKVLERYDELQTQVNLEKAGLRETVCTCPKCGYSAEIPATVTVFLCPNEDCHFESCKKCREASHIPLRCEEVESKAEEAGRTRVEEAASAAVIRFCPKCKKGIVKSDGCNKMTCGCGTKFCYLCRAVVKDYTHFCQIPHCTHQKCKGCPLYTQDLDAEHEKNMREAALAEAKKVEVEAAAASAQRQTKKIGLFGLEEKPQSAVKVNIDVDSILQAPKRRRAS